MIHKFPKMEMNDSQIHRDRKVAARGWEEGDRELLRNGNRVFVLQDGSRSVDGWWGPHDANVFHTTELHLERIQMTNFMVCGSYDNEKKRKKKYMTKE